MPSGVVIFSVSGSHTGSPSCATSGRWAFNASTGQGQLRMSALLTAYANGKPVTFWGTSACDAWADSETLDYFLMP